MLFKFGSLRNLKKVLIDYISNHGAIQTFQKVFEILFLFLIYRNSEIGKKEYLSEQDVEWIKLEIAFANRLDSLIEYTPSRLTDPIFTPMAEAVTFIIKNINVRKQKENLTFQNIIVGPGIGKYLQKLDLSTSTAIETNRVSRIQSKVISLNEGFPVANKKSRIKILLLICFSRELKSVTFINSKFNRDFYNDYGDVLKKFNSQLIINWV